MASSRLRAQSRPETVRVLCGYPAGGSVDIVARRLADRLGKSVGRSAMVENRPVAAGRLVIDTLKNASAVGSTLLVTPGSVLTMYPHIYRPLGYDVFVDMAPVAMVASTEFCLAVGPAVPANVATLGDFAAWRQANPAQANCGNAVAGSLPHFTALLMSREIGLALNHVPYRSGLAAKLALTGGQVSAAMATEGAALALEQAGKLRVLATTAAQQSVFFPKAPNFVSLGYKLLAQREWFAVVALAAQRQRCTTRLPTRRVPCSLRPIRARPGLAWAWCRPRRHRRNCARRCEPENNFWGPIIKASGFTTEA